MSGPIYNAVRHSQASAGAPSQHSPTSSTFSDPKLAPTYTKADLRADTKHRKRFAIFTSFLFVVTLIFLILVQIGNLSNQHVLGDLYFFKIDVTNIVVTGLRNQKPGNTLAKQAGLHDFYQVGMWNFCEGFNDQGITACSKPQLMYWFNPIQILIDEILNGDHGPFFFSPPPFIPLPNPRANAPTPVNLPPTVTEYLYIIRTASQTMFVLFFASTFTSFLAIFLCPLAVYSRLVSIPIALFALLSALMTFVATGISTGMWSVFQRQLQVYGADMHVVPSIGRKMSIFTWIAAGCALFAAFGQLGMMCCGTSRRDIRTGRRVGRKLRSQVAMPVEENPALRRRWWGSVSQ